MCSHIDHAYPGGHADSRRISIAALPLLWLIQLYRRFISPALPPSCRYTPTCSRYALDALRRYGALRGSWLALWRVLRCNPWTKGGYDPLL